MPALCAGVVQLISDELDTLHDVFVPPKVTPKLPPLAKPVPLIVTAVPPAIVPDDGPTEEIVGPLVVSVTLPAFFATAKLRPVPNEMLLFEKVLNLVHRLAPNAAICFNTTPADTAEAVQRWVDP